MHAGLESDVRECVMRDVKEDIERRKEEEKVVRGR